MIRTRIASTAAVFTFGLAALGGAAIAVAAPGNAAPGASGTTSTTGSPDVRAKIDQKMAQYVHDHSHGSNSTVGSTPTSDVSSSGGALTSSNSTKPVLDSRIQQWLNDLAKADLREEAQK